MRIGLHTTIISLGRYGHFTCVKNLVHSLACIDRVNKYIMFYNYFRKPPQEFFFEKRNPDVGKRLYRFPLRLLESLWSKGQILPLESLLGKIDIFHSLAFHLAYPDFYLPPLKKAKLVVTIHDLIPLKFPHYFMPQYVKECQRALEIVNKKVDLVITDSETSKRDIATLSNLEVEKIKVIYNGVSREFQDLRDAKDKIMEATIKYGINREYILFIGGGSPTKNIFRLIDAFTIFKENSHLPHQLVLGGVERQAVLRNDGVIATGYIAQEDLPYIYSAADLFIFPSLYEGFGLAILEAMACGTPVITSSVSSLPEVAGDAAIFIDPYNVEDIALAMQKVLTDQELQKRLSQKGLERAKFFSWERAAQQTLKAYREVKEK